MRGKRFATSTLAAAALAGRQADAFLHQSGTSSGGTISTRRSSSSPPGACSLMVGVSDSRIFRSNSSPTRRPLHAASNSIFNGTGRSVRLNAATLDLSASASNEHLHTLPDNNERPRPIVICGPSGVGKGTIISAILKKFPASKFGFSVSHTTRQPRPGEVDGEHYNFVSIDQIKKDIEDGNFLEYAEVHGNYYGTSLEAVESIQRQGKLCILDIDVQGVQTIKNENKLPDALYVFVAPPSVENLEGRLRGRGTETVETLARRLGNARKEMEYGQGEGNFDMYLVNGKLKTAVNELADKMKGWYPTLEDDEGN